ncbi:MAG: SDR family NAD(P)-dependent oxidoreductase [Alphaproteobacteria bacterium]
MDLGLSGKVALITGSGSGIGQHMAVAFAAEGAMVAVNDISAKGIEETLRMIEAAGGAGSAARCDITDTAAVGAMVATAEKKWGRLDILVNNAAVMTQHALFLEKSPEQCDQEIRVTLYGTINCIRAALPGMIARKYGKIVNIATDAARVGQEREAVYAAAKGGVISFTKSIAREVGRDNINANVISPGATNSPMRNAILDKMRQSMGAERVAEREEKVKRVYPLRRIGEMEDVSNAVLFAASDRARHITGQVLSVNGGFAML